MKIEREDVKIQTDTCIDFVYNDLDYTKNQILHATVHLNEEIPLIHCVLIPILEKLDNRSNIERCTISQNNILKTIKTFFRQILYLVMKNQKKQLLAK